MDEVLKEHLEDVCGLVSKLCEEKKFEGLEIILDSGLNLLEYDKLFDLKLECMKGLGDDKSVGECSTQLTEAKRLRKCHVDRWIVRCEELCKKGEYGKALAEIDECGVELENHLHLWENRIKCLKALGRFDEAFHGAVALVAGYDYDMTPELLEIIVAGAVERGPETSVFDTGFCAYTEVDGEMKPDSIVTTEVNEQTSTKKESTTIDERISDPKGLGPRFTVEIPLQFNHFIGNSLGNKLYEGIVTCPSWTRYVSFISATSSQICGIDMLQNIGCENEFMVSVSHSVYDEVLLSLLVVEPLVPLRHFFRLRLDSFTSRGSNETMKGDWWRFIADAFTQIFGDVVHGLIYLRSLARGESKDMYVCSDLQNHRYVDKKGRGKILSLLDHAKKSSQDWQNLLEIMQEITTLPFLAKEIDDSYELPLELMRLFQFSNQPRSEIPYIWVYNHPFFWSSQERVDFIKDLKEFMKEDVVDEKNLKAHLQACYGPCEYEIDWSKKIDAKVFEEIFLRPKIDNSVKKYDETLPIDMVRYMTACYGHINDYIYTNEGRREEFLRSFFPEIYINLYEAFFNYVRDYSREHNRNKLFKAFTHWSHLYFKREVPRIVEDIGTKVFQSIYPEASSINPPKSSFVSKNIDWDKVPDRSRLSPCLRALLTCAKNLNDGFIEIPIEEKVMNIPHSLRFGQEEIIQLLKKEEELEALHMSAYIRLLYEEYEGLRDTFSFLYPSMISLNASEFQARLDYIVWALDGSKNKVLFAPDNVGRHWILCLIDPKNGVVHYLNPSRAEPPEDLKNVVEAALHTHWGRADKEINWRSIKCPWQTNFIHCDCGYYVLRFMREILCHGLTWIPHEYFADCASDHYDQGQINEIVEELACQLLQFSSPR